VKAMLPIKIKMSHKWLVSCSTLFLTLFAGFTSAAPVINGIQIDGSELAQGVLIKVRGSGFGKKSQAAPKLYDKTDIVYENGTPNLHYSSYLEGADIVRQDQDPEALWTKSSEYLWGGVPPNISRSGTRGAHVSAHYSMPGIKSYLG